MDKNTITGFLLIAVVMIVFTLTQQPSEEQLRERKRLQDSIQQVEQARAQLEAEQLTITDTLNDGEASALTDFFGGDTSVSEDTTTVEVVDGAEAEVADDDTSSFMALSADKTAKEELITIENDEVRLMVSTKGGWIYSAELKEYKRYDKDTLFLFRGDEARFNLELFNNKSVRLNTESETFTPILSNDGKTLTMRLGYTNDRYIDFEYSLPESGYMVDFDIKVNGMASDLHAESLQNFRIKWDQKLRQQEKGAKFERRYTTIYYKYAGMDVKNMSENKDVREEYSDPIHWFAYKDQFFTTTFIGDKPFTNTILSTKSIEEEGYLKDYEAEVWAPVSINEEGQLFAGFQYYLGPVHYTSMKALNKDVPAADRLHLEKNGEAWLELVELDK